MALGCACVAESEDAVPQSCAGDGTPECEMDFMELCASRTFHEECTDTARVERLGLECSWVVPHVVVDVDACVLEPAAGRCVALDYPGDTDCTMWHEDGDETLVAYLGRCYPIGWNDCDEQSSPACACLSDG